MGKKVEGEGSPSQPAPQKPQPCCARPGRKGIWWLIGGLLAFGAGAGYRWWKQLPK